MHEPEPTTPEVLSYVIFGVILGASFGVLNIYCPWKKLFLQVFAEVQTSAFWPVAPLLLLFIFCQRWSATPVKSPVYLRTIAASLGLVWGWLTSVPFAPPHGKGHWQVITAPLCLHCTSHQVLQQGKTLTLGSGSVPRGSFVQLAPAPRRQTLLMRAGTMKHAPDDYSSRHGAVSFIWSSKQRLLNRLQKIDDELVRAWIRSSLLGEYATFKAEWVHIFKIYGLLHLLVVSGAHITIICHIFSSCLRLIVIFLTTCRIFSTELRLTLQHHLGLIALVPVGVFCVMVGFGQSTQRAFFIFLWQTLLVYGNPALRQPHVAILLALVSQMICYPFGLLSGTQVLSWVAFFIVAHSAAKETKPTAHKIFTFWQLQAHFVIFSVAFFGVFQPVSFCVNLLVLPLIPFLTVLGMSSIFLPLGSSLQSLTVWVQSACLRFFLSTHQLLRAYLGELEISCHPALQGGFLLLLAIIFLKTWQNKAIRHKGL